MYAVLWRVLPGPRWLKALQCAVLAAGFVVFCFLWLFPRIEHLMPFSQTTVDDGTGATPAPTTSSPSGQSGNAPTSSPTLPVTPGPSDLPAPSDPPAPSGSPS